MRHETPLIEVSNQNTNSNEFNLARLNTTNIFLVISVACFSYSQCFSSKLFLKLFWTSFSEKGKTKLNKNVSKKKHKEETVNRLAWNTNEVIAAMYCNIFRHELDFVEHGFIKYVSKWHRLKNKPRFSFYIFS